MFLRIKKLSTPLRFPPRRIQIITVSWETETLSLKDILEAMHLSQGRASFEILNIYIYIYHSQLLRNIEHDLRTTTINSQAVGSGCRHKRNDIHIKLIMYILEAPERYFFFI